MIVNNAMAMLNTTLFAKMNIIKTNGKWLHYDTSAGYHVVFGWNNKQRKAALNGRNWDHSKWPVG